MEFADKSFNTAGIGLFVVGAIVTFLVTAYGLTTLWISKGHVDNEKKAGE
ncbi:MAG: hypothetical protein ACYTFG_05755 [Planctomycetota bacterium]|jgi:hypothetical protein